jgi:hypothetical protein
MKLYTSYWNKPELKRPPYGALLKIGISRRGPYHGMQYENLVHEPFAPSEELLREWKASEQTAEDEAAFERKYRAALDAKGIEYVRARLEEALDGHEEAILLCHEKTGKFCHRRLFAHWWREQTGQEIPELDR